MLRYSHCSVGSIPESLRHQPCFFKLMSTVIPLSCSYSHSIRSNSYSCSISARQSYWILLLSKCITNFQGLVGSAKKTRATCMHPRFAAAAGSRKLLNFIAFVSSIRWLLMSSQFGYFIIKFLIMVAMALNVEIPMRTMRIIMTRLLLNRVPWSSVS